MRVFGDLIHVSVAIGVPQVSCHLGKSFQSVRLDLFVEQVPDVDVSAEEVDRLVFEADAYSLSSHLMWGTWALLQSKVEF